MGEGGVVVEPGLDEFVDILRAPEVLADGVAR